MAKKTKFHWEFKTINEALEVQGQFRNKANEASLSVANDHRLSADIFARCIKFHDGITSSNQLKAGISNLLQDRIYRYVVEYCTAMDAIESIDRYIYDRWGSQ
jgi:hypothetical protein